MMNGIQDQPQRIVALEKRTALFDQLLNSIEQRFSSGDEAPGSIGQWAERTPIILDGRPFTFERHEYLQVPYEDDHPFQVEMKAAQVGNTTKAILRTLFYARFRNLVGILYLFPSRTDVLDFSRGRINTLISENPNSIGRWLTDTDSAGLKRIWNTSLYLRGMQSRVGLKSVPVDMIVFDELDEAPQNSVDMAMERMGHSEFRIVSMLSNPTLPDYGIDKAFQETDQRYWLLRCERCGEYTCLEDSFPDCLLEVGGRVMRGCHKCHAELNPSIGEWVAKRPSIIDKRGYHYSQLFSHYIEPASILHQFRTTNNMTDFFNLKMGVPFVEAINRLTVQEVLALCGNDGIASSDPGPCSVGVDQGKELHVVVGKRHPGRAGSIIHVGVYRDWEELDRLMKVFRVSRCVVDALPETRNARAFAERHRGRVFLNYYNEHQKGKYRWNEADLTVQCNRTESLDSSHNEILNGKVVFPKECEIVQEFAQHLHNVAKRLEEDEETGSKRYVYVRLGPDHFRHAFNYEAMARQYGAGSFFSDCA